jgi:hypothetical protein
MVSEDYDICYTGEIITRRDAKSLGLKRYFTNKPCKHGHISQRYVNSGTCCKCGNIKTQEWRSSKDVNKGACKEYNYKELPPLEDLERLFEYNEHTGKIYWRERSVEEFYNSRSHKAWNTHFSGKEAGSKHYVNGYIEIRCPDKKLYKAQRIAWKLYHKTEPAVIIDHINGNTSDNRITNLRESSHQENSRNMKGVSETGYKGVTYSKTKKSYVVNYCVADTTYVKGGFNTAEDAAREYDKIVKDLYGDFAFLNFPDEGVL